MKIIFSEFTTGASIQLIPETPGELSQLARLAINKAEKPVRINLYLYSNDPGAVISIDKIKGKVQQNVINSKNRK